MTTRRHDRDPAEPPRDCAAAGEELHRLLDGEPFAEPHLVERHCRECPECRSLFASARLLLDGIGRMTAVAVPSGFADRAAAAVLRDRPSTAGGRRWLASGSAFALAACLLIAVFAMPRGASTLRPGTGFVSVQSGRGLEEGHRLAAAPTPLADRLAEAGDAVVSLTRKTADLTFDRTLSLLPRPTLPRPPVPSEQLAPAVQSLAEVPTGAAAGLEPLADATRRAVNLLWDMVPAGSLRKPSS